MKRRNLTGLVMSAFLLGGCASSAYTGSVKLSGFKTAEEPSTFCTHIQPETIDADALAYYENSAFVGDSRADTIREFDLFYGVDYAVYAAPSLDLNRVFIQQVIPLDNGLMGTMLDALAQRSFSKVFVSFGLNELGWYAMDVFEEQYTNLVNEIKALQPNAQIYLMSVYPFAQSVLNNYEYTTLDKLAVINQSISNVAANTGVMLLDQSQFLPEGSEYLPEEWTFDGYHLNADGANAWFEMMLREGEGKVYVHEKNPCNR